MVNLTAIRDHIKSMLTSRLSKSLTYHNANHTLDVTFQCLSIAKDEGVSDKQALCELQVAALYHDTGFIYTYDQHEEKSCEIARQQLPGFGINKIAIDNICHLILATKVPQAPISELQKIICDADLDYLGREDFFEKGDKLRLELITYKLINGENDWEELQLDFLRTHQYFTKASRDKRGPLKLRFLNDLVKNKESK